MALSLNRNALLSRLTLVAVQRFIHTVPKDGNDLERKQEKNVTSGGIKLDATARTIRITRANIPPSSFSVLQTLKNAGFEAYLVGGCVRDLILNKVPKDFDVITTATLEKVKSLFNRAAIIGNNFPICRVHINNSVLEVSNFQTGQAKGNKQNFPQMPQGLDKKDALLWSDAMRRDFTVNSLFFDPFAKMIYDYAGGVEDLRSMKLHTIIPAHISFEEDCARILRGLRIAARIDLSISEQTETAMHKYSSSITSLTKSRLMMEMNYMLSYGAAEASLCLLCRFDLLKTLLPLHAAHLARQIKGGSEMKSLYLMRLFSNLDKLVTCDRPTDPSLWVAILAFHLSLLNKPQAPLVIWTFGSLLYNNNWPEAVEFARKKTEVPIISLPEISESFKSMSDDVLIQTVVQLAISVKSSAHALTMADDSDLTDNSDLVYIPNKTGKPTAELFNVLTVKASILKKRTKSVQIDSLLLGKGYMSVTRCALGKIILDTMSSFLCQSDDNSFNKKTTMQPIQLENTSGSNVGGVLHNEKIKPTGSIQSVKKVNQEPTNFDKEGGSKIGVVLDNEKNKQTHGIQIARKKKKQPIKLESASGSNVGVVLHNEKNKQVHDIQCVEKKNHPPVLKNTSGARLGVVLENEKNKQAHDIQIARKKNQQPIKLESASGSNVGVVLHMEKSKQVDDIQCVEKKNHSPIKLKNTSGARHGVELDNEKNKQAHYIQSTAKKNQQPIKLESMSASKVELLHNEKNNQGNGREILKNILNCIKFEPVGESKAGRVEVQHNEKTKQSDGSKSVKKN